MLLVVHFVGAYLCVDKLLLFDFSPQFPSLSVCISLCVRIRNVKGARSTSEYLMLFVYLIPPFTAALFVIRVICTFSWFRCCCSFFVFSSFLSPPRSRSCFAGSISTALVWLTIACCSHWYWMCKSGKTSKTNASLTFSHRQNSVQNDTSIPNAAKKPKSMLRTLSFTFGGNFRHFSWITHHFSELPAQRHATRRCFPFS